MSLKFPFHLLSSHWCFIFFLSKSLVPGCPDKTFNQWENNVSVCPLVPFQTGWLPDWLWHPTQPQTPSCGANEELNSSLLSNIRLADARAWLAANKGRERSRQYIDRTDTEAMNDGRKRKGSQYYNIILYDRNLNICNGLRKCKKCSDNNGGFLTWWKMENEHHYLWCTWKKWRFKRSDVCRALWLSVSDGLKC